MIQSLDFLTQSLDEFIKGLDNHVELFDVIVHESAIPPQGKR